MAAINGIYMPLEIWENIFSYISSSDVINFCRASPEFMYFLKQRNIVKTFDVSEDYYFIDNDLGDFIELNVSFEYIKALNINKLYWIPLDDLRKIVKSLKNLEELYALNTKLSLRAKDVVVYSKLKTLAITIDGNQFIQNVDPTIYKNNLYLLRKLCINFTHKNLKGNPIFHRLFSELYALKELWICDLDDSDHALKYDIIVAQMKFLEKLVIKSSVNIPFLDYKPFGLAKYFESRRFRSIIMKYEHLDMDKIIPLKYVSIFQPFETDLEAAWQVLHTYKSEMPYDPDIHRQVYFTKQIKTAKFRELNFYHHKCFCTQDYIKATFDFLRAPNSRDLKKLSVKSCVLQRYPIPKGQHDLSNLTRKYPISEVIKNCQSLTTLELMQCASCNITILDGYPLLCGWKNLERFTIEVPSHLHGKFLVDLLQTCKRLKFLRIISHNTNEQLNRYLYQGLRYASNLEDFSFENKHINLPALFYSLLENQSFKLRRIYICCDNSDAEQLRPMEDFLLINRQLLFLCIVLYEKSRSYINRMQMAMNNYIEKNTEDLSPTRSPHKTRSSHKFFFAKNSRLTKFYQVPEVHRELFNYDTEVSGVDFYEFR
ncbi:unnamed protein product [Ceutorhynchus assimilis]|uniref:F-box domain-containing protein n=1 Tax=Ceutorhynchus assimilis TaxID=467358 RepID=A0A9N9MPS5_9CUCU|nr:unnamed protein product [Ceutorhynchus assimilis]